MLGSGRAHVAEICDLARANVADGLPSAAIKAFSSLGTEGRHNANQERDLHRWLHNIYNVNLTTYKVPMKLTDSRCNFCRKCLNTNTNMRTRKGYSCSLFYRHELLS